MATQASAAGEEDGEDQLWVECDALRLKQARAWRGGAWRVQQPPASCTRQQPHTAHNRVPFPLQLRKLSI